MVLCEPPVGISLQIETTNSWHEYKQCNQSIWERIAPWRLLDRSFIGHLCSEMSSSGVTAVGFAKRGSTLKKGRGLRCSIHRWQAGLDKWFHWILLAHCQKLIVESGIFLLLRICTASLPRPFPCQIKQLKQLQVPCGRSTSVVRVCLTSCIQIRGEILSRRLFSSCANCWTFGKLELPPITLPETGNVNDITKP